MLERYVQALYNYQFYINEYFNEDIIELIQLYNRDTTTLY